MDRSSGQCLPRIFTPPFSGGIEPFPHAPIAPPPAATLGLGRRQTEDHTRARSLGLQRGEALARGFEHVSGGGRASG